MAAVIPDGGNSPIRVTNTVDGKIVEASSPEDLRRVDSIRNTVVSMAPRVVFVLLPVFAVLTFAFYRRVEPQFVAHLYFALHAHAFAFLVFTLGLPFRPIGVVGRSIGGVIGLWLVPYFYLSLRRFSEESWTRTMVKGTAIGVLYLAVVLLAMLSVFVFVMRTFRSG
jgi:hypothetical protein